VKNVCIFNRAPPTVQSCKNKFKHGFAMLAYALCKTNLLSSHATTEMIFHPPHLSRPVLDPELMRALLPGPTARSLSLRGTFSPGWST
jgi:hypothetical protein